jgi:hypothetical protein
MVNLWLYRGDLCGKDGIELLLFSSDWPVGLCWWRWLVLEFKG